MSHTSRSSSLAILGAPPAFAEALHVGRPNLGSREALLRRINGLLDRNWLTNNGPLVQEFEQRVAERLDVAHCVATCNGTVALEIAIRALGLSGEVIVPSFTFVATAHALKWQEITPVFCDIDPRTHTIDPEDVERRIGPRTAGIIGVHLWGRPCDVARLEALASRRGLTLLFDASHAFGCTHAGRLVGGCGAAEVFSFHATKFINSAEGGAITTSDGRLAERLRLMRNFGFAGYDNVVSIGSNGKMSELSAAMGLTSLESFEEFVDVNFRNHESYTRALAGLPGLALLPDERGERRNYQYVVVEVDPEACPLTRDELLAVLHADNVLARRYFYPGCHRMEPYGSLDPESGRGLPVTEAVCRRVLVLPTGTSIGDEQIATVGEIVRAALAKAEEIRRVLSSER
ncbi:MAG TPA: DegT/DnrJ/EryC1/StrS family aminotransferase [Planctomycetaceae bacterium]|nr:DegT/DnrJ/EryC1/StrS family aminotransferase [Planctomycetaceae bacterium]